MKYLVLILTFFIFNCLQAQVCNNPYKIFGYEPRTKCMDSNLESLQITSINTENIYNKLIFNFYTRSISYLNTNDSIVKCINFESDQLMIWLGIDPLTHKYPSLSPYNFVENSPIIHIDPDGREKIVITGGEYTDENRYKYNFVEPAIKQLKTYKLEVISEQVTWAVMNVGYSNRAIKTMQNVAKENGVSLVLLNSAEELTNYVNSKSTSISELSECRSNDQVTSISVFGHGFTGSLELGYNQDTDGTNTIQSDFSYDINNVSQLEEGAFKSSKIDLYTCNAMTPINEQSFTNNSLGSAIHEKTGGTVSGYWGRTDYANMNKGETKVNKLNRWWNGFNTNGSVHLPQPGSKTVNGQTTQSTKVTLHPPITE